MSGNQSKITTHEDRQKNTKHNKEKNRPIKNDPEIYQMLELAQKGIGTVITVFHMVKRLGNIDNLNQTLEIKTKISEIKNTVGGINGRLDIAKEKLTGHESIPIKIIHNETHKKNKIKLKEHQ